jgi:hypothetical protein
VGKQGRNTRSLLASAVASAVYDLLLGLLPSLTGLPKIDGAIGVVLGLYTCSHPAANAIDALFYSRGQRRPARWAAASWLGLNAAVLLVGWFTIVAGVTSLVR